MSRKIKKGFSRVCQSLLFATSTFVSHVITGTVRAEAFAASKSSGLNRISIEGVIMRETAKLRQNKARSGVKSVLVRFFGAFPFSRRPILPSLYAKYLANSNQFEKDATLGLGALALSTKSASTRPERRSERFYKVRLERPHAHATLNLARDDLEASYALA